VQYIFHPLYDSTRRVRFDIWATDDPGDQYVLQGHCSAGMKRVGEVEVELEPRPGAAAAAGQGGAGQRLASPSRPAGYSYGLGWGGCWPCGHYLYGGMWAASRRALGEAHAGVPAGGPGGPGGSGGSGGGGGGSQRRRLLVEIRFGCGAMEVRELMAGPSAAGGAASLPCTALLRCWAGAGRCCGVGLPCPALPGALDHRPEQPGGPACTAGKRARRSAPRPCRAWRR
jgi:hypothetical protein